MSYDLLSIFFLLRAKGTWITIQKRSCDRTTHTYFRTIYSTDIHQDQSFSTEGQFRRIVRMFIIQKRSLYIFTNSLLDNDEVINILAISIICFRSENIQKQQLATISIYSLGESKNDVAAPTHQKMPLLQRVMMQLRVSIVGQVL